MAFIYARISILHTYKHTHTQHRNSAVFVCFSAIAAYTIQWISIHLAKLMLMLLLLLFVYLLSFSYLFIYSFISEATTKHNSNKKNQPNERKLILIYKRFCNMCINRFESFHSNGLNYLKWDQAQRSFSNEIKSLDTRKVCAVFTKPKIVYRKCQHVHVHPQCFFIHTDQ